MGGHESDTTPYVDSIVISLSHMTQFTADEQMRVTFESHRNKDLGAGVGETDQIGGAAIAGVVGSTDANVGTGDVIQKYKGKVAIRWMKLKFSAAACYVGKVASEDTWEFDVKKHEPQELNVRVSFRTPKTAQGGAAGGHGALTVVSEGDFSSRHAYLSAVGEDGTVLGRLFHDEEWVSRSANRRPLSEEQTAFDSLALSTVPAVSQTQSCFRVMCWTLIPVMVMSRSIYVRRVPRTLPSRPSCRLLLCLFHCTSVS